MIKHQATRDMEKDKFVEDAKRPGLPAVAIRISNPSEVGGGLPFSWDSFLIDRTDSTSDVYTYSLGATPTGEVTINYTDTTKCIILGGSVVIL